MRKVKTSGPKRMRELGYVSSTVWLDKLDAEAVRRAAKSAGMSLASYLRRCAVLLAAYGDVWEDPRTGRSANGSIRRR